MALRSLGFGRRIITLSKSRAARGAGTLALGTAIGQGIITAAAPLLTRLYSPSEMGEFGTFIALTNFFIAFVCLRLEQTILLVQEGEEQDAIASCLLSSVAMVLIYEFVIAMAPAGLRNISPNFRIYAAVLGPLSILSSALYVICQHIALRTGKLSDIARYQVSKSVISTALQLFASLVGLGFIGLAAGQGVGLTIAVLPLLYRNRHILKLVLSVRREEVAAIFRRYPSFPLYGAPQAALNALTASLPMFMIGAFFGSVQVGLFWLGFRVFGLPNQVIVESIRGGLLNSFSKKIRDEDDLVKPLFYATSIMAVILLPITIILFFLGPTLFGIIFGPQWSAAGEITTILSVGWIFQNARVPATTLLQLMERQRIVLILEICGTLGRALALASAAIYHSLYFVLVLFVAVNLLQSIGTILMASIKLPGAGNRFQMPKGQKRC